MERAELFETIRRAYPYRELKRERISTRSWRCCRKGLLRDAGATELTYIAIASMACCARGVERGLAAITSGGAIPENALYTVVALPENMVVGTIHEDFAVESLAGDVFLLGNTSWRVRRVQNSGSVLVEDANGAAPSVPFWLGEAPARTAELSEEVANLRQAVSTRVEAVEVGATRQTSPLVDAAVEWLKGECGLDDAGGRADRGIHRRRDARCCERCPRRRRSWPSDFSMKAAGCS